MRRLTTLLLAASLTAATRADGSAPPSHVASGCRATSVGVSRADRDRADSLADAAVRYDGAPDYPRQIAKMQASLTAYEFPDFSQRALLAALATRGGDQDLAFRELERLLACGWLDVDNITNFPADNRVLLGDPRWRGFERRARTAQAAALARLQPGPLGLEPTGARLALDRLLIDQRITPEALVDSLAAFHAFPQPRRTGVWTLHIIRLPLALTAGGATGGAEARADQAVQTPERAVDVHVFVRVPDAYRAMRAWPVLLWSHQGWFYRPAPQRWTAQAYRVENPFADLPAARDWIQVVPLMWRDVDGSTAVGQAAFREILAYVRRLLNVDDDRVVFAGHSNGASAAYRAIAEGPSPFAGALAINGWPDPGLPFRTFANRPVAAWTGARDMQFPAADAAALHAWAAPLTRTWSLRTVDQAGHGLRAWIGDERAAMFAAARAMRRDSFGAVRIVEAPVGVARRVDWLVVEQADTTRPRAAWHRARPSPPTTVDGDGAAGTPRTAGGAGSAAPAANGVVEARYAANTFDVKTSRVARFALWLSPRMVDFTRPVVVRVNGVERFRDRVSPDRRFTVARFLDGYDRRQVWVARLPITVPGQPTQESVPDGRSNP